MVISEHQEILKKGRGIWKEWRNKNRGIIPDLSGANLRDADLTRVNLNKADLGGADLSGAKLIGADLSRANLNKAKLIKAKLNRAYFLRANFNKSDLDRSILIGANLERAILNNSNFSSANLRESNLSYAKLNNTNFENAFLDDAIFSNTEVHSSNFNKASIDRIRDCSQDTKEDLISAGAIIGNTVYADETQKLKSLLEYTKFKLKAAEEESMRLTLTSIPAIPLWQNRNFDVLENLCFVIMPFTEKNNLKTIYLDHTKKIIESFGLDCKRADDMFKHDMIMEDIWENICVARFIVSDLTDKNPNVFYELGMAHTLGKRVVLITQKDEDVPFDLHHLRYIKYEFTPPGMKKFEDDLIKKINSILNET